MVQMLTPVKDVTVRVKDATERVTTAWERPSWLHGHRALTFVGPIVALVLAMKMLVLFIAITVNQVFNNTEFHRPSEWFRVLDRWDAPHYLSVAEHGYQTKGDEANFIVFFPGYPWLVRVVAWPLGGNYLFAAFLVSGIASIAAAVLLGYLVRFDSQDADLAHRAVWFFLIFPTSYFLHVPYTESLFMALLLGAFLAARQEKWLLAGLLGAAVTLTRINGLVLIPALAMEAYSQYRLTRRLRLDWLWIVTIGGGIIVYLLVNKHVYGSEFKFMQVQKEHWAKTLTWPWEGITNKMHAGNGAKPSDLQMLVRQEMLYIWIGLVATIASWFWLRPSYAIWMTGNWLLFTSTSFILSTPRYTLTLFPIFIMLAKVGKHRLVTAILSAWSLAFYMFFAALYSLGRWAY